MGMSGGNVPHQGCGLRPENDAPGDLRRLVPTRQPGHQGGRRLWHGIVVDEDAAGTDEVRVEVFHDQVVGAILG
jgi:hypothetical protein